MSLPHNADPTVGDNSTVVNFAFAPTSVGGLGINYTITPEGWLYTVSHTQEQQEKVNIFVNALKVGGKICSNFLMLDNVRFLVD
ncbi:hypothetical protein [Neisseria subflava]|uniref:hypothetical protein n=1 Tax=Neisseria subflava TaxID=28449 RepID=UPI00280B7442|nr:hypothetical protein [Neisseria subflava]